ncbi:PTS system mannose/fructose/sorbose family transporter subunit IID [Arsenophonus sp. PmNCSU2021_1]|uniref:PTS system mannose/fructose/sorbose family transporter subunit IID n=1 Tax=Arsenophonus sp. PmNCSU2021_1 TaxID=3118989 RepID=UPI003FA56660
MAFNGSDEEMANKSEQRMAQALATSQVESDDYIDTTAGKALTSYDINVMALRSLLLQASFNYERMQAGGWLYTLIPALPKIHNNPEDLANSMKIHHEFRTGI